MKLKHVLRIVGSAAAAFCLVTMYGCAGYEVNKNKDMPYYYIHKELPTADRAVESARQAGKSQQCPNEFKAAEDLKRQGIHYL